MHLLIPPENNSLSLYYVGVAKWMDMDLDPNGRIKKGPLVHYNPLFFFFKKKIIQSIQLK